jgi:hypothetical protein
MIVQNNYSALVLLAIVILAGAVVLGLLLTNTEVFNPAKANQEANAYATKSALDARERAGILQATETPRAFQVAMQQTQTAGALYATQARQTAIAQATAIPVQQTATQVAIQSALGVAQANATQTALAVEAYNKVQQAQATQTRIAGEQTAYAQQAQATATSIAGAIARDADARNNANTRESALTVAITLAIVALSVGGAALLIAGARAKSIAAEAMLEREKRRTLEVQASARAAATNVIPLPAARAPKNGHGEQEKIAA